MLTTFLLDVHCDQGKYSGELGRGWMLVWGRTGKTKLQFILSLGNVKTQMMLISELNLATPPGLKEGNLWQVFKNKVSEYGDDLPTTSLFAFSFHSIFCLIKIKR